MNEVAEEVARLKLALWESATMLECLDAVAYGEMDAKQKRYFGKPKDAQFWLNEIWRNVNRKERAK